MTQRNNIVIHIVTYLIGIAIIGIISALYNIGKVLSSVHVYVWTSVTVMYTTLYFPFLFSHTSRHVKSAKKRSLTMLWAGIIVFIILSIGITISVALDILQIKIAIVIECVLIILVVIDAYVTYFEAAKQSLSQIDDKDMFLIRQIWDSFKNLNMKISTLNDKYSEQKNKINKMTETIQKLVVVDDIAAVKLEQNILMTITTVSSACDKVLAGNENPEFLVQIAALNKIVGQRYAMQ